MYDRRTDKWDTTNAHIFNSFFGNETQKVVEVRVNSSDFKNKIQAESEVNKYCILIGRLPGFLVSGLEFIEMHGGDALWGGSSDDNSMLIHTIQGEKYIKDNVVYNIIAHELTPTVMDNKDSTGWKDARLKDDGIAISEYAKDYPEREDLAETISLYILYSRNKLPYELSKELKYIQNRINYLDKLNLKMEILP